MKQFLKTLGQDVSWTLSCPDRIIFRGHLPINDPRGLVAFLHAKGVSLEEWAELAPRQAEGLRKWAEALARQEGRPYRYLRGPGQRKEDLVDEILRDHPVEHGLIAVFSAVERCTTFRLRTALNKGCLRVDRDRRKCLFLYFYWLDDQFGRLYVRLQTWYPFTIEIYVNGHHWLAREMARRQLGFVAHENAFTDLADPGAAQKLADRLVRRKWPRLLQAWAARCNPLVRSFFGDYRYYWVTDQVEFSLDIRFRTTDLARVFAERVIPQAQVAFSPEDLLTFLGRKRPKSCRVECLSDYRWRLKGFRLKHRVGKNWIKAYSKGFVLLRIEVTINRTADFSVRRSVRRGRRRVTVWTSLCKGVGYFSRCREIADRANARYADALAALVAPPRPLHELSKLAAPSTRGSRSYRALNPLAENDYRLLRSVLHGEDALKPVRNRDLRHRLFGPDPHHATELRARSARVSRLLALLHAHGLVAKVPRSHAWRLSTLGWRLLPTLAEMTHRPLATAPHAA